VPCDGNNEQLLHGTQLELHKGETQTTNKLLASLSTRGGRPPLPPLLPLAKTKEKGRGARKELKTLKTGKEREGEGENESN
jgi:hypothetical protein